jgi:hypothetical protein
VTKEECRQVGKRLFALFDTCQRRLIEAEVVMGQGRRNAEERGRLAAVVHSLRCWMHTAKELGVLKEFSKDANLFLNYLRHEIQEQAVAEKIRMPLRTELFLESGTDVAAPASKPVQHLDFDPDRVLHPRS